MLKPRRIPGKPLVFCQHCMAEETGVLMSGRGGSNKTDTLTRSQAGGRQADGHMGKQHGSVFPWDLLTSGLVQEGADHSAEGFLPFANPFGK